MTPAIDLRCAPAGTGEPPEGRADLVIADPPWSYRMPLGEKLPTDHYDCIDTREIAAVLRALGDWCRPGARMAVWCTFPLIAEWMRQDLGRWRYTTGGAWCKRGGIGQGYHWRGDAEVVLVYVDGRAPAGRPRETIRSGHVSKRGRHSAKPIAWQRDMIRAWSRPGSLVIDPFAGLGSVALAALAEGRDYLGWEIDPDRHAQAVAEIDRAQGRGLWVAP